MQFFIFVLLICLFVFIYCIYLLTKDDFIFLRRDVTMERLFNIIFSGALVGLFTARLFYGLFNREFSFLNPFVFLFFPYFPGLSLVGGVLGAGLTLLFLRRNKKNPLPLGRMSDFFSIAFLIILPIGILGYFMFSESGISVQKAGILITAYFVLFILFLKFLLPSLLSGKLKEGTIALIFLILFSLINLISNAFAKANVLNYFKNPENLTLIAIFLLSLAAFFKWENFLIRIKEFKKGK